MLNNRHLIMAFDHDMAMDDKVTNSVVRITGKADLKALATEGELPAWVMTAIKPSEFRIEVKDLYERMEKAKKAKQTPFHTVFTLARSSWPWMESKNLSRDAAVIPMCARLEYSAVEHYRAHLLATSDAGALLRHELNTILENLSKNTSRIVKDAEGRVQNVTSPQWTYPDGIKIRIVDGKTVREGIVLTQILSDKEMLKVVEVTKDTIQKLIHRLESLSIAKVDPSRGSPVSDRVARKITELIEVRRNDCPVTHASSQTTIITIFLSRLFGRTSKSIKY